MKGHAHQRGLFRLKSIEIARARIAPSKICNMMAKSRATGTLLVANGAINKIVVRAICNNYAWNLIVLDSSHWPPFGHVLRSLI
jgi:hypothetical protein